ncbi:MAG: lysine--tRNA ligase, partial [Actinobacteria bacterium]|nr:lysine--tRNA ligase [Actinomycetota bacterium]
GAPVAYRRQPDGRTRAVDLSGPWRAITVHDAVGRACGTTITPDTSLDDLIALCHASAVPVGNEPTSAGLVVKLYEQLVEAVTVEPTFYLDFPIEASPLTRVHRDDPRLAERWDLVAFGQEIGTAYSELNDPVDQRRRLTEQSLRRAAGDVEAMQVDEDFLDALGYAMPPTGGLGLGVDRLVMMLTGVPIRETLAFPFAGRSVLRD